MYFFESLQVEKNTEVASLMEEHEKTKSMRDKFFESNQTKDESLHHFQMELNDMRRAHAQEKEELQSQLEEVENLLEDEKEAHEASMREVN